MKLQIVSACRLRITHFWAVMSLLAMVCCPSLLHADWTITQTVQLKTGWNSVFLEAEPADAKPDTVFNGLPVDKVITYYPLNSSVQFIQSPDEIPFNKPGWHVWVPQAKPESFLKNLYVLQANQGYLIHCTQDVQWQITGSPKFQYTKWQPESFNFIGFHINPAAPPAFTNYLGNADAFSDGNIYYLSNGKWLRSSKTDAVAAGQAYWIFCKGGSDFKGALEIKLPSPGENLSFAAGADELSVEVISRASAAVSFTAELLPNTAGDAAVPLSLVKFTPETGKIYTPFTTYSSQTPLESGKSETIRFAVRRGEIAANEVKSLLKITDNAGGMLYIPVSAVK